MPTGFVDFPPGVAQLATAQWMSSILSHQAPAWDESHTQSLVNGVRRGSDEFRVTAVQVCVCVCWVSLVFVVNADHLCARLCLCVLCFMFCPVLCILHRPCSDTATAASLCE